MIYNIKNVSLLKFSAFQFFGELNMTKEEFLKECNKSLYESSSYLFTCITKDNKTSEEVTYDEFINLINNNAHYDLEVNDILPNVNMCTFYKDNKPVYNCDTIYEVEEILKNF